MTHGSGLFQDVARICPRSYGLEVECSHMQAGTTPAKHEAVVAGPSRHIALCRYVAPWIERAQHESRNRVKQYVHTKNPCKATHVVHNNRAGHNWYTHALRSLAVVPHRNRGALCVDNDVACQVGQPSRADFDAWAKTVRECTVVDGDLV